MPGLRYSQGAAPTCVSCASSGLSYRYLQSTSWQPQWTDVNEKVYHTRRTLHRAFHHTLLQEPQVMQWDHCLAVTSNETQLCWQMPYCIAVPAALSPHTTHATYEPKLASVQCNSFHQATMCEEHPGAAAPVCQRQEKLVLLPSNHIEAVTQPRPHPPNPTPTHPKFNSPKCTTCAHPAAHQQTPNHTQLTYLLNNSQAAPVAPVCQWHARLVHPPFSDIEAVTQPQPPTPYPTHYSPSS
jgi:hypothetical protein